MFLPELGVPPNAYIRKACEHMFSYQRESGAFSASFPKTRKALEDLMRSNSCLTGKILGFMIDSSYEKGSRTQKTIKWLSNSQEKDELFPCPHFNPNPKNAVQNCYMGITKPITAFPRIPFQRKNQKIREFMRRAVKTMLSMDVKMYRLKGGESAGAHNFKRKEGRWILEGHQKVGIGKK